MWKKTQKKSNFIKKHKITCLLTCLLAYLIIGTTAPFWQYPEISPQTEEAVEEICWKQGTPGVDRTALLETNESAWEERIRLLSHARERIVLVSFDIRPGESTKDILSVLLNRADAGVQIRILVDGFSTAIRMEGQELFYALSSHPNVEIRSYNKLNPLLPWKLQGRMHDKYVIVDDEAYILGGRNTFDYFIGTYTDKHVSQDREVLVYNTKPGSQESSLRELEAYFEGVWNLEVCSPFHNDEALARKQKVKDAVLMLQERYTQLTKDYPRLFDEYPAYEERTYETGSIRLLSNPTGIYAKEPLVFYQLIQVMKQAQQCVVIQSPYVVCNAYMCEALTGLKQMVPDIKILLNSVENGDNFVASSDYLRNKGMLVEIGIPLYEYDGGTSNHGKSILIDDDLSIIGSYNLDLRSSYLDTELMLVIESRELNQELRGHMDAMEADSRRVVDADTYDVPEHVKVKEIPLWKQTAFAVAGFLLQPFRYLI